MAMAIELLLFVVLGLLNSATNINKFCEYLTALDFAAADDDDGGGGGDSTALKDHWLALSAAQQLENDV